MNTIEPDLREKVRALALQSPFEPKSSYAAVQAAGCAAIAVFVEEFPLALGVSE
jgi:hypothetical protein